MKYKVKNSNPVFGIASMIGILLILSPFLFSMFDYKRIMVIGGLVFLMIDLVVYLNQFQNKLFIKKSGLIELNLEDKLIFEPPFNITYYSSYANYELPLLLSSRKYSGSSGYKKEGKIRVCLNILIKDNRGQKILLLQNLFPWQETPRNWKYETIDISNVEKVKVLKAQKILTEIITEPHSFS